MFDAQLPEELYDDEGLEVVVDDVEPVYEGLDDEIDDLFDVEPLKEYCDDEALEVVLDDELEPDGEPVAEGRLDDGIDDLTEVVDGVQLQELQGLD